MDHFAEKFDLFGPSTLQHNTLTFGDMGQDACTEPGNVLPPLFDTAKTPVKRDSTCTAEVASFSLEQAFGIVDLSSSYSGSAPGAAMIRGLALLPAHGGGLLVVDEGASGTEDASLTMQWHLHTFANVSIAGSSAKLTMGVNGTMSTSELAIVSPADCPGAAISVAEVANGPNSTAKGWKDLGMRRVSIAAPAQSCRRLCVALGAGAAGWGASLRVNALAAWNTSGPVGG